MSDHRGRVEERVYLLTKQVKANPGAEPERAPRPLLRFHRLESSPAMPTVRLDLLVSVTHRHFSGFSSLRQK